MKRPVTQREKVILLFKEALEAVNPYQCIREVLQVRNNILTVSCCSIETKEYNIDKLNNMYVVGCGKAAAPMVAAVEECVGERITGGIAAVNYGYLHKRKQSCVTIVEAGHPEPDANSVAAAKEVYSLLVSARNNDLVIALLSGGGSSLWALPVAGIHLKDMKQMNRILIGCGASIGEINCVRKPISQIKGGKAAHLAFPAQVCVFSLSDVIGDDPGIIASGPFSPNNQTVEQAIQVIDKYRIRDKISPIIIQYLEHSLHNNRGVVENNDSFSHVTYCVCGNNRKFIRVAVEKAKKMNYSVTSLNKTIYGEAKLAAKKYISDLLRIYTKDPFRNHCIISGGETTVTLGETVGAGGRNQEFALAASLELERHVSELKNRCIVTLLSCGTDGTDGPTDAAGAIVNLTTLKSNNYNYINDAKKALEMHDSYSFFDKINALVRNGPTNTNVMDVQIALIDNIM